MSEWKQYFFQPKDIKDLIKTATVVVDTNVLLSAYQWRNVTVEEVLKVLETLSNEDRLKIPYQVVKEFSKNRPGIIKDRLNELEVTINSLQKQKPLNERAPMLEGQEIFNQTERRLRAYNSSVDNLKKDLKSLRDKIKDLFSRDPYLDRLSNILDKSFCMPSGEENEEKIREIARERFKEKTPPGFKDSDKEENSEGDYIIWHTILGLDNDVIFISNDKKKDWVYTDKHDEPISARRELVEEFYKKTNGLNFIILTPQEFISLYDPNVSQAIREDLKTELPKSKRLIASFSKNERLVMHNIFKILRYHDPLSLSMLSDYEGDAYLNAAKEFLSVFQSLENKDEIREHIFLILNNYGNVGIKLPEALHMVEEIEEALVNGKSLLNK